MNYANDKFMSQGYINARKGILIPRPISLNAGQVIYRFYDSTKVFSPLDAANGAWWIEYEYFQKIKQFALQYDHSFSYSARLFAAILYEWSEVDCFVRCELKESVKALKGRGKKVESTGKDARDLPTMTPMQSVMEIYQLYIPGFGGPGSISSSMLKVLGTQKL